MTSFLVVNGMTVRAQITSTSLDAMETMADQQRGIGGSLNRTRLAKRKVARAQTIPMDADRAFALRSMLRGQGLVAPFTSAILSASRGILPATPSTYYQTNVAADGRTITNNSLPIMAGGTGSVFANPAVSNLLPATISNAGEAGTTGFAGISGMTVSSASDRAFVGSKSLMGTWPTNNASARVYFTTPSLTQGRTYQLTFWAMCSAGALRTTLITSSSGATIVNNATSAANATTWTRTTQTFVATATSTVQVQTGNPNSPIAGNVYIDGIQLLDVTGLTDVQAFPPPWQLATTQATTGLVYSGLRGLLGSQQGATLNIWCSAAPVFNGGERVIARATDSDTSPANGLTLTCDGSSPYALRWQILAQGNTTDIFLSPENYSATRLYMLTAVIRTTPRGSQSYITFYINGQPVTTSQVVGLDPTAWAALVLARYAGNVSECDALPFCLTDADVATIYSNTLRMGLLPQLQVKGLGYTESFVALGTINREDYVLAYDQVIQDTVTNGRIFDISLQEI